MKQIEQQYIINAPIDKVWQALTNAYIAEEWGAGPAKFDGNVGGEFSYWGGEIHGKNTKIIENKLLEQDWYGEENSDNCYKVCFSLSSEGDSTTVKLVHADVPDEEYEDYAQGWKDFYFDPIKQLLETN